MLNPEITCGLFLSKIWKSSRFKLPTEWPCASRTTTGTSTAFTFTSILAPPSRGGIWLVCGVARWAHKQPARQPRAIVEKSFALVFVVIRSFYSVRPTTDGVILWQFAPLERDEGINAP